MQRQEIHSTAVPPFELTVVQEPNTAPPDGLLLSAIGPHVQLHVSSTDAVGTRSSAPTNLPPTLASYCKNLPWTAGCDAALLHTREWCIWNEMHVMQQAIVPFLQRVIDLVREASYLPLKDVLARLVEDWMEVWLLQQCLALACTRSASMDSYVLTAGPALERWCSAPLPWTEYTRGDRRTVRQLLVHTLSTRGSSPSALLSSNHLVKLFLQQHAPWWIDGTALRVPPTVDCPFLLWSALHLLLSEVVHVPEAEGRASGAEGRASGAEGQPTHTPAPEQVAVVKKRGRRAAAGESSACVQTLWEEHIRARDTLIEQTRMRRDMALARRVVKDGEQDPSEEAEAAATRAPSANQVLVYALGDPKNEVDATGRICGLHTIWGGWNCDSRLEGRLLVMFEVLHLTCMREPVEINLGKFLQLQRMKAAARVAAGGDADVDAHEDSRLARILFGGERSACMARPDFLVHFADGATYVEAKPTEPSDVELARAEACALMGLRYAIVYGSQFGVPFDRSYRSSGSALRWKVWEPGQRISSAQGSVLVTDASDKRVSFAHIHSVSDLAGVRYDTKLLRSAWYAAQQAFRK